MKEKTLVSNENEHRRGTKKGDLNINIAQHHLETSLTVNWNSIRCVNYSTDYYQCITLKNWFTNLEQNALNRCLPLPTP